MTMTDFNIIEHDDGTITDTTTGELLVPAMSEADRESLEAFGMTVDECFEQGEDERRAERANEYALEGVTNYEEGSYLEKARDEARAWSALDVFDKNEPY